MASLLTTILDAALGRFTRGGAQSNAVKWSTSSNYSAAQDAASIKQPPASQTDEHIRLIQYGTTIPRVSGTQLISVNAPFWKSALRSEAFQSEQGVKYNYFMDLAYPICVGPIIGIHRVWQDGELRAEYGSAQSKLPGTLYLGNNTQTADSVISAAEGAINTPAFRGLAYIVLENFWLGTEANLPVFQFEVVKGGAF